MPTLDPILHTLALMAPSGYFIGLHIRYASPLMQFSNYDQNWLDHYTEKAYALRDPTIAWGFSQEGACRWDEMGVPDPFGLFTEAKSFGLTYGLTVSCGPIRSRTISSFARSLIRSRTMSGSNGRSRISRHRACIWSCRLKASSSVRVMT